MTNDVSEWLPLGATASGAVRRKIDEVVDDWAKRWFTAGEIGVASLTVIPRGLQRGDGGDWRVRSGSVTVRCLPALTSRVLDRALGVTAEGLFLTEPDRRVVNAFTQRLVEDLAMAIERAVDIEGAHAGPTDGAIGEPLGSRGGLMVNVADGRDELLAISIQLQAIVEFCKAGLPIASSPRDAVTSVVEALKPTDLVLEACLGRAHISLADLRALTPGDIVVLDATIESGGEIVVRNSDRVIAHARLDERDGRLALTLQPRLH